MSKITNTGELRNYLCNAIEMVGDGDMSPEMARNIVKLSAQVNDSLYAEVKVAKTQLELGAQAANFGDLQLGSGDEK